jgi:hypothetical protein
LILKIILLLHLQKALELAEFFIEKKEEALKYLNGKKIQCELNVNKTIKDNIIGSLELSITHVNKFKMITI